MDVFSKALVDWLLTCFDIALLDGEGSKKDKLENNSKTGETWLIINEKAAFERLSEFLNGNFMNFMESGGKKKNETTRYKHCGMEAYQLIMVMSAING